MGHRYTLALMCLSTLAVWSAPAQAEPDPRLVTVNGHAEIRVVPDEVTLSVGVETFNVELSQAKSENDARVTAVIDAAVEQGISREHIKNEYLSVEPVYESDYKKRHFLHYQVRRTLVITLRDVNAFEALLSSILEAGASHVHGIDFRTTELRKYRDEARALAIAAAREKAEALAGELGESIGRAHSIQEGYARWWSWYGAGWGPHRGGGMAQNVIQSAGTPDGSEGPTTPGQITVDARVTVAFVLED